MKQHLALLAGMVFLASGMTARTGNYGTFVAPLDDGLWSQTQWISAADAPEMNELVNDTSLAADGASWFLTTVKNAKKVKAAQWMATSLGVFDLYVNGKAIGEEVLKTWLHTLQENQVFLHIRHYGRGEHISRRRQQLRSGSHSWLVGR